MYKKCKKANINGSSCVICSLFFVSSCDLPTGGGGIELGTTDYSANSIEALKTWLGGKPANTAATPYNVALNTSYLIVRGGDHKSPGSLVYELGKSKKYVNLDLSGSTITNIPDNAFYACEYLTGIKIPDSVSTIGLSAFEKCTSLVSVNIPDNVTLIDSYAFAECGNLASITIPDKVTVIGGFAFLKCTGLGSVTIGNSFEEIWASAFNSCTGISGITIPASVKQIRMFAFGGCSNLIRIQILCKIPDLRDDVYINDDAFGVSGTFAYLDPNSLGDLRYQYYHQSEFVSGTPGTYYRTSSSSREWFLEP